MCIFIIVYSIYIYKKFPQVLLPHYVSTSAYGRIVHRVCHYMKHQHESHSLRSNSVQIVHKYSPCRVEGTTQVSEQPVLLDLILIIINEK
jgi:hypothetical protein